MTIGRYSSVGTAVWVSPDGTQITYLKRRLLPQVGGQLTNSTYRVRLGDRVDTIAAAQLGDGTLSWMVADPNLVTRPTDLSVPGQVILVPQPGGITIG